MESSADRHADPRRHAVLACFCFHSFIQCFSFMDFSTDSELTYASLGMGTMHDVQLLEGLLYSGGFAATLPAMWASLWLLLRGYDWTAGFLMSLLIVAGAWLRLVAVVSTSYALALTSTILLGAAGGVIFTSFTFVPARWFPPNERPLATALAVQSNYAGWALGCLNVPMFGVPTNYTAPDGNTTAAQKSVNGLTHFLWIVAFLTTMALPVHILVNRRRPRVVVVTTNEPIPEGLSFCQTVTLLARRRQYIIHSACYATLGAVGYAVTGVVDPCFSAALKGTDSFDHMQTMYLNVVFVASGVMAGLLIGRLVPDRPAAQSVAVRSLFVLAAIALLGIQVLLFAATSLDKDVLFALSLCCMCAAGVGTLGFIGVGLRVAVRASAPAEEIYAGSIIEFFLLAIAAALGLLTYVVSAEYTFWFFALPACASAVAVCTMARFETTSSALTTHDDQRLSETDSPFLEEAVTSTKHV